MARQAARYLKGQASAVLLGSSESELRELFTAKGLKPYRAQQVLSLVAAGARTLDDLRLLPKADRDTLANDRVAVGRSEVEEVVTSVDGTKKLVSRLTDGLVIETAAIPTAKRLTVCVSSQAGCAMKCAFCATGKGGFARNLMPHEILDQVLAAQEKTERKATHIVFMGMGEPLLNLPAVLKVLAFVFPAFVLTANQTISCLTEQFGMSGRSLTVSTVGVPDKVAQLAQSAPQTTLAFSLHAPSQELREELVPAAKSYPLSLLMAEAAEYFGATGRRITFEYVLLAGVNDSVNHAQELADLLRRCRFPLHVNLLPWNPVADAPFRRPDDRAVQQFARILTEASVDATVRTTRGMDAAAACGQLRNARQSMEKKD